MDEIAKKFSLALEVDRTFCQERFSKSGERELYVIGRASGIGIDHDEEQMTESAIEAMNKAISDGLPTEDGQFEPIPLMNKHQTEWDDQLGYITRSWIDENYDLFIEAKLDTDHPHAEFLYKSLTTIGPSGKPKKQIGLSVGGYILEAGKEYVEEVGKYIRRFYQIGLDEVSVTGRPAYPTAYLDALAKSLDWQRVRAPHQYTVGESIMKSYKPGEVEDDTSLEKAEEVIEEVETVEKAEGVEETVEELEKSEDETSDEEVEKSYADATGEITIRIGASAFSWDDEENTLESVLNQIVAEISNLKGTVEKHMTDQQEDVVVEKAEEVEQVVEEVAVEKTATEDETVETVEKSEETSADEVVLKAVTETVSNLLNEKFGEVVDLVKGLETRVREIEETPIDGSLSVSKAEDRVEETPAEILEKATAGMTASQKAALLIAARDGKL